MYSLLRMRDSYRTQPSQYVRSLFKSEGGCLRGNSQTGRQLAMTVLFKKVTDDLRREGNTSRPNPHQGVLYFCKMCERYLQPPDTWVTAALESRELLSVCLKKLKGLNKVRLIDAAFIWTEPHSRYVYTYTDYCIVVN